jgi:hypothetical protein
MSPFAGITDKSPLTGKSAFSQAVSRQQKSNISPTNRQNIIRKYAINPFSGVD